MCTKPGGSGDTPSCHRPSRRRGGLSPHPTGLWRLEDESLKPGAAAGQEDAPEPALSGTVAAADDDPSRQPCVSEATTTRTPGKERRGHASRGWKVCVGQLWREGKPGSSLRAALHVRMPRQVVAADDWSLGGGETAQSGQLGAHLPGVQLVDPNRGVLQFVVGGGGAGRGRCAVLRVGCPLGDCVQGVFVRGGISPKGLSSG